MAIVMWCRTGVFDKVECKSKNLESAAKTIARKIGHHSKNLFLLTGGISGSFGDKPIRTGTLCRTDRHGNHVIKQLFWHDA